MDSYTVWYMTGEALVGKLQISAGITLRHSNSLAKRFRG